MLQKHLTLMKIAALTLIVSLTACSGGSKEPSANSEASSPVNEATSPASTQASAGENENEPAVTRPDTKDFELMTSEGNQKLTAKLHQGKGFILYVFDMFAFDANKGSLYLSSNPKYEVTIEPLSTSDDLEQLKAKGKEELKNSGKVFDYSGELVEHPLRFAEIYLQASGEDGISDYIVWKSEAGDQFLFRLHNPKGEEASDFAGPVLVSLSTVQSESK